MKLNKKLNSGLIVLLVITLLGGTYASIFFSKKIFLEDFNVINNEYKQLLFNSGKEKRAESIQNYESFVPKLTDFADKYTAYKPYAIKFDIQFDQDLSGIQNAMLIINPMIYSGDLVKAHEILEGVRAIFQEILKRDGFSLLTVALVDFHDVMEELITASDEKNTETLIATYNLANEKLTDIETNYLNDDSIKQIRSDLLALLDLAQQNKADDLAAQAQKLKASFIKVYLKN